MYIRAKFSERPSRRWLCRTAAWPSQAVSHRRLALRFATFRCDACRSPLLGSRASVWPDRCEWEGRKRFRMYFATCRYRYNLSFSKDPWRFLRCRGNGVRLLHPVRRLARPLAPADERRVQPGRLRAISRPSLAITEHADRCSLSGGQPLGGFAGGARALPPPPAER